MTTGKGIAIAGIWIGFGIACAGNIEAVGLIAYLLIITIVIAA